MRIYEAPTNERYIKRNKSRFGSSLSVLYDLFLFLLNDEIAVLRRRYTASAAATTTASDSVAPHQNTPSIAASRVSKVRFICPVYTVRTSATRSKSAVAAAPSLEAGRTAAEAGAAAARGAAAAAAAAEAAAAGAAAAAALATCRRD